MVKKLKTEERIIEAAKRVFTLKGMDGARMQEIADEAGINKALLHYYFRTKDLLFERIFTIVFNEVFRILQQTISKEVDFTQFLEDFIRQYIKLLKSKPFIPQFVIHELNRKPQRLVDQMRNSAFNKDQLFGIIEKAAEDGIIRPIPPIHFVMNILSMCIFPFIAKPIITGFMLDGDKAGYKQYIDERPEQVVVFVKRAVLL